MKTFQNPEGHQNRVSGLKDIVVLLDGGGDFAYCWSCIERVCVCSLQQACLHINLGFRLPSQEMVFILIWDLQKMENLSDKRTRGQEAGPLVRACT